MVSAPGTMGYGLAGFLAFWTVMMAAMMLPAVAPVGGLYARTIRMQTAQPQARAARVAGLVAGYLSAWATFGLAAFAIADVARRPDPGPARADDADGDVAQPRTITYVPSGAMRRRTRIAAGPTWMQPLLTWPIGPGWMAIWSPPIQVGERCVWWADRPSANGK